MRLLHKGNDICRKQRRFRVVGVGITFFVATTADQCVLDVVFEVDFLVRGLFLFQLFLAAFNLLDALLWRRQDFRHCAAQLVNGLAHFLAHLKMGLVGLAFTLHLVAFELFFCLGRTEQVGG
ncbi:hypothetical protein [Nitrosomonas eutropha]|uniref:hypothetical protein n=1 Tax=Nitrosomonas eutropha TaxID=916 RepID=UPI0003241F61|nr:hypothetical protein [Nitrosomonas eutropha]